MESPASLSSIWGDGDDLEALLYSDAAPTSRIASSSSELEKGLHVEVSALSYALYDKSAKRSKTILQDVNFLATPGGVTGILGSSGAGKSTLLDLIAGRKREGKAAGTILFNGQERAPGIERASAYVTQESVLFADLTVRETLSYAARLRMPAGTNTTAVNRRVAEVLELLRLTSCGDSFVGDSLRRGIAGGQRKRLSIGVEMVDMPSLVFFDEPTTGLDSAGAAGVFATMCDLARPRRDGGGSSSGGGGGSSSSGRTVLATLHQPGPALFSALSRVLLLHSGRVLFFGPPAAAEAHFTPLGFERRLGQAVADFIVAAAATPGNSTLSFAGSGSSASSGGGGLLPHAAVNGSAAGAKAQPTRTVAELADAYRSSDLFSRYVSNDGDYTYEGAAVAADRVRNGGEVVLWGRSNLRYPPKMAINSGNATQKDARMAGWRKRGGAWWRRLGRGGRQANYQAVFPDDGYGQAPAFAGAAAKRPGVLRQFWTLLARAWRLQFRATDARKADFTKNLMVGLMAATVFRGQGHLRSDEPLIDPFTGEPSSQAANALSLLYFGVMYGATGHMQAIPEMFFGKEVFMRERDAGLYSAVPHWLAQTLAPLPPLLAAYLIYGNLAYWATGMPADAGKYFFFLFSNWVSVWVGYASAQAFAAASPSPQVAFSLWPMAFIVLSNFAGYGVRVPNVAWWWRWLCDVSFCRWFFQAVAINGVQGFDDGDDLLRLYGFYSPGKWVSLAYASIWYFGVSLMTLVALLPPPNRLKLVSAAEILDVASPENEESLKQNAAYLFRRAERYKVLLDEDGEQLIESPDGTLYLTEDDGREKGAKAPLLPKPTPALAATAAGAASAAAAAAAAAAVEVEVGCDNGQRGNGSVGSAAASGSAAAAFGAVASHAKGCTVVFRDICYTVYPGKNAPPLTPLRGVSGKAEPGRLLAILGASGAGKSTLLDILAGRKKQSRSSKVTGTVLYDGKVPGAGATGRGAYVAQDNVHIASITVRQSIEFATALRLPGVTAAARAARRARVDLLLSVLRLNKVEHSLVGNSQSRGVSGGELRRLSIAVEIAGMPDVIYMDEATSGLDSATALEVMEAARALVSQGRTVVCALHQPAPAVFALCDDLLLMAHGLGIYFGRADRAAPFFSSLPFLPESLASEAAKPAGDFVMLVAAAATCTDRTDAASSVFDHKTDPIEAFEEAAARSDECDIAQLLEAFHATAEWRAFDEATAAAVSAAAAGEEEVWRAGRAWNTFFGPVRYPTPVWWQMLVLTRRHALKTAKDPSMLIASVVRHAFVALLYGLLWWRLGDEQLYERMSLLFFSIVFVCIGNQQSVPAIFQDRLIFYRERSAGVSSTIAYWTAVSFASVPQLLVNSCVYSTIVYFMAGLNRWGAPGARFGYFSLILALSNVVAQSYCQLLAVVTPSQQTAVALFPITLFFFIIFSSFIVRIPTLPAYLRSWAPAASFSRWSFEGLVVNEFDGNWKLFPPPPGTGLTPEFIYQLLLDGFGFGNVGKWQVVPILLLNLAVFRTLGYVALRVFDFGRG